MTAERLSFYQLQDCGIDVRKFARENEKKIWSAYVSDKLKSVSPSARRVYESLQDVGVAIKQDEIFQRLKAKGWAKGLSLVAIGKAEKELFAAGLVYNANAGRVGIDARFLIEAAVEAEVERLAVDDPEFSAQVKEKIRQNDVDDRSRASVSVIVTSMRAQAAELERMARQIEADAITAGRAADIAKARLDKLENLAAAIKGVL